MRILTLSDVHDEFERFAVDTLPDADVVVCAGDLTNRGVLNEPRFQEVSRARDWLITLTARYSAVLWIPGNHDIGLDAASFPDIPGLTSLLNRSVVVGGLRFYGVSCSPCYDLPELIHQWVYQTINPEEEAAAYAMPPVDVVVSHAPPYGCLDAVGNQHIGSRALRNYIEREWPRLVVCGHVHEGSGRGQIGSTVVLNVARRFEVIELAPEG